MVENKYFYYLLILNGLINVINFVPRILIENRFQGALMSILVSVVIGSLILFWVSKLYSKFPGEGLPEILQSIRLPILTKPILFLLGCFWFLAGAITLVSFVDITTRYITPDLSPYWIMAGFLIIVCLSCRLNTASILFGLEMLLLLNTPFIFYFLGKSLLNEFFNWDSVTQAGTYLFTMPNYESIAAATFIFSGYTNAAIFNRVFGKLNTLRYMWLISLVGISILCTTFFIPIGYHGTQGVEQHIYPWFSTADSIRIELFVIERILFVFYLIYITLSLVSSIIHWHVSLELLKSTFKRNRRTSKREYKTWIIIGVFAIVSFWMLSVNQEQLQDLGRMFLNVRFILEIVFPLLLLYVLHRRTSNA